jgi:hypothetical protein
MDSKGIAESNEFLLLEENVELNLIGYRLNFSISEKIKETLDVEIRDSQ